MAGSVTCLAATAALLAGAGCSSMSLRASEARAPILLGPTSCIGCAPEPARAAAPATVAGGVHQREYIVPIIGTYGTAKVADDRVALDAAATKAVSDPCREDLRVSNIEAGTWSFDVPLLFGIGDAWIDVQAARAAVANGSCAHASRGRP